MTRPRKSIVALYQTDTLGEKTFGHAIEVQEKGRNGIGGYSHKTIGILLDNTLDKTMNGGVLTKGGLDKTLDRVANIIKMREKFWAKGYNLIEMYKDDKGYIWDELKIMRLLEEKGVEFSGRELSMKESPTHLELKK